MRQPTEHDPKAGTIDASLTRALASTAPCDACDERGLCPTCRWVAETVEDAMRERQVRS